MFYFFVNLLFHLMITIILASFVLRFASINRKRKNIIGWSYFLPVICCVLFLLQVFFFTMPRMADSTYAFTGNLKSKTIKADSISFFNSSLKSEKEKFHYNPLSFRPQKEESFKVYYTPYAHYIIIVESQIE